MNEFEDVARKVLDLVSTVDADGHRIARIQRLGTLGRDDELVKEVAKVIWDSLYTEPLPISCHTDTIGGIIAAAAERMGDVP